MTLTDFPRLRMFAGPNGSGKSTIKSVLKPDLLGYYVNPDEIEKEILAYGFLDLEPFGIRTSRQAILDFFQASTLLSQAGLLDEAAELSYNDGKLDFFAVSVNAYFASVAADFIRQHLLQQHQSFTFETVMSSPDKVAFLQKAQRFGYRTYLYYVATEDPLINISRVQHRVRMGGHSVPPDKIVSRYHRSLDLLVNAIRFTNRAYLFDNSGTQRLWVAEVTDGHTIELQTDQVPEWFRRSVLAKI